jgi:hypothetical protein
MFLGLEKPWEKIFWRPYLYKILVFMESYRALMLFLLCFVEVFSRAIARKENRNKTLTLLKTKAENA